MDCYLVYGGLKAKDPGTGRKMPYVGSTLRNIERSGIPSIITMNLTPK